MSWPGLLGFALLNTPCPGMPEWVHLPCLRQAGFGFFRLDEGTDEVGVELVCPECRGTTVLVAEDWKEEIREASLRRFPAR